MSPPEIVKNSYKRISDTMHYCFSQYREIMRDPVRPLEMFLSVLKILWGLWLMLPFVNGAWMDVPTHSWGAFLVTLGSGQMICLMLGWVRPRMVLSMVAVCFWGFMAGVSWFTNPSGAGAVLTAWVAIVNIWIFARLARRVQ